VGLELGDWEFGIYPPPPPPFSWNSSSTNGILSLQNSDPQAIAFELKAKLKAVSPVQYSNGCCLIWCHSILISEMLRTCLPSL
jgi:hypothetical protein